ncbi:unnamed protein product [Didymodactylos carnosus]|uniref:Uncharacterized protein n=1 Tax=Didymodactylos carnosus TaxID=1234261 RepID=A0A8S2K5X7_9BILA|nr:unnamed protein product [Didymodactylos carnosus]CAF3838665.1 unnamed protein product [Didymodactylos carnosus]
MSELCAIPVDPLHYSASLFKAYRLDLSLRHYFLRSWNGVSVLFDPKVVKACDMELFTDAPASTGFGGYWEDEWFASSWPDFVPKGLSVAYYKLLPLVLPASLWGRHWGGKMILFR